MEEEKKEKKISLTAFVIIMTLVLLLGAGIEFLVVRNLSNENQLGTGTTNGQEKNIDANNLDNEELKKYLSAFAVLYATDSKEVVETEKKLQAATNGQQEKAKD